MFLRKCRQKDSQNEGTCIFLQDTLNHGLSGMSEKMVVEDNKTSSRIL